ncbi:MAG TPA: ornithine carbamoyltransferase [Candidatus Omnitrophica bacterium]|nr:ornithine carbamoyltransferase [Candidatus Omnitrophota bacterium]
MKDLIAIRDLTNNEINDIFSLAQKVKKNKNKYSKVLSGKSVALIFQKPSLRTRVSFEVGIDQLGGSSIYLGHKEINLGVRESVFDVAKTLSRYVDAIMLRTFEHKYVSELAEHADVPVINGLSDLFHPCQALSDIFTIKEKRSNIKKVLISYIGDGNNVCNSLLYLCAKLGISLNIASPQGYSPDNEIVRKAKEIARELSAVINVFTDAKSAAAGADVLYTDVWASMGQEAEREKRILDFKGFQINDQLLSIAKKDCLIMHCLPAHRDEEITDSVLKTNNAIVFDQAENRLHVQKAVLIKLFKDKK